MKINKYLILLFCVITLVSCYKEDEDDLKVYADIAGVVDNGATPVEGAEIHIRSHFSPGGFTEGESIGQGIPLRFNAANPGTYQINLFRLGVDEVLVELLNDSLSVGEHTVLIPDSILTNGVYIYRIVTPFNQTAQSNFLINKPDSALTATLPLTTTNSNGEFEITAEYLAIDETFFRGQDDRFTITDSLQIIVVMNEEIIARKNLTVGEEVNFVEINLD